MSAASGHRRELEFERLPVSIEDDVKDPGSFANLVVKATLCEP